MKKKELEKLDKLNQEKKLTKDVKEKISKKVLNNFLIAVDILLFFIILMIIDRNLNKESTILIYKISSIILFIFTLVLFEIAYKKDNDVLGIHGIEMLVLSIITLFTPYIFIDKTSVFTSIVGAYYTAYYILKNLVIYKKEKNNYLREQSDIKEIVKKESQDKLAQEQFAQRKEDGKPKKRGRPKKVNN